MRPLPLQPLGAAGASTAVLALHGFGGAPASFEDVARHVGLRAATLPGHCGLDAGSFDDAVARVGATVDAVAADVDGGVVLWGYSLGARLALACATARRGRGLRALILESGRGTVDGDARADLDDERAAALVDGGVDAFFAGWERGPLFAHLSAAQQQRRRAWRVAHAPHQLAAALRSFSPGRQRPPRVAGLRLPVLLIAGARDAAYVDHAEHLTRMLPACRLSIVRGAGHIPHFERPDAVGRVVNDFLAVLAATTTTREELRP